MIHHLLGWAILAAVIVLFIRKGRTAKAIKRQTDRQVWSNASDLRPARYPRTRPFARKHGLK